MVGAGAKPFKLYEYQEEALEALVNNNLVLALKARQIGMTTIVGAYALWSAFFHDNTPWVAVSKNQQGAQKILKRILYGYDRLPAWLKLRNPIVARTQMYVEFKNGSYIEAEPSVASTGRGDSVYGTILDEFAFMDYPAEVYAAVQPLTYGPLIIISTANGMGNTFYDLYLDSQREVTAWKFLFYPWDVVPTRNEKWYERNLLEFRGQEWLFYQEYPATAEEAFIKSGRVAFSAQLLSYLEYEQPQYFEWMSEQQSFVPTDTPSPFALKVWEEPTIEHDPVWKDIVLRQPNYVIGVDTALGLEHGDRTAVTVWNANTGRMVASMCAHFPIEDLHNFLWDLGEQYFWALMVVERNASGIAPLVNLWNMRYPRIYRPKKLASRNQLRGAEFGWNTTVQSKPKMVVDMLAALRDKQVMIHDETFGAEAAVFVADGKGGYSASEGRHDDFVMATLVGWQGVLDVGRFPPIFHVDTTHPVTFDEFFSQGEPAPVDAGLDSMIIGGSVLPKTKTAYFLHPSNVRKRTN